jgi:hypothetical protein
MARGDRSGREPWFDDGEERDENGLTEAEREKIASWSSDEALAALDLERRLHPDETPEELTKRIFRENAAGAASRIVRIAVASENERVALDASKYIADRVLGRVGDTAESIDPLEAFMKKVEDAANAGSGN